MAGWPAAHTHVHACGTINYLGIVNVVDHQIGKLNFSPNCPAIIMVISSQNSIIIQQEYIIIIYMGRF